MTLSFEAKKVTQREGHEKVMNSPKTMIHRAISVIYKRRGERGQAIIEFALLLPVLIVIIIATFELARVFIVQQHLVSAAELGARTGTIRNNTVADVESAIRTYLENTQVNDGFTTTISGVGADEDFNSTVVVTVNHTLTLFTTVVIPGFDGFTVPLEASITMRHQ